MKSLFIVSLPRSLSSYVYQLSSRALGLEQPLWTTEGEVLNVDRLSIDSTNVPPTKFLTREHHSDQFGSALLWLNSIAAARDCAYKDVVQPFVTSEWLRRRGHEFNVLRIKRNIADVAWSMLNRRWLYPTAASMSTRDSEDALVEGLMRADRVLDSVSGETIAFDQFIYDSDVIWSALSRLYPEVHIVRIASDLSHNRQMILERRSSALHRHLNEVMVTIQQQLLREESSGYSLFASA